MENKNHVLFFIILLLLLGLQTSFFAQNDWSLYDQIDTLYNQPVSTKNYELAKAILQQAEAQDDYDATSYALSYLGYYYSEVGEYEAGLLMYQKLYRLSTMNDDQFGIVNAYFGLGSIYYGLKIYNQALAYYRKAEEICKQIDDKFLLTDIYNGIGNVYSEQDLPEQALQYLLAARKLSTNLKEDQSEVLIIDNNLALLYAEIGQPLRAIPYLKKILAYEKTRGDSLHLSITYSNLAYTYQNIPDFEQAFMYFDTSLYYSNLFKQEEVTYATYKDMSDAYLKMGKLNQALDYQKRSYQLEKLVVDRQTQRQITALEVKFDTERKEKELLLSEKEVADLKISRQQMGIFLLLTATIAFFCFLLYRKAKEDAHRKQELQIVEERLLKSDLKNKELEAKQLKNQLDNKQSDLTNLALDIARKNDFSKELAKKLEELQQSKADIIKTKLRDLMIFMSNHLRINEDLTMLQSNIEQINQTFYIKLDTQFSNLSANDRYVLGLIRLNLSNKDIAAIKGISTGSAKVLRYRLRKKLQLASDVDFASFLQRL